MTVICFAPVLMAVICTVSGLLLKIAVSLPSMDSSSLTNNPATDDRIAVVSFSMTAALSVIGTGTVIRPA